MSTAAPTKPGQSQTYELGRPTGKCSITGADIAVGEKFMAALRETPMGFERLDISMQAWPTFDRKDVVGFWQTTMPAAEQKKKLFVDDEVLCELFQRLQETEEQAKLNFRFVLGLILMRKKLLVYDNTRHAEGKDIWTVHFKGKEERLDLVDPKLNEAAMTEVSQQLGQILNEEL